MVFDSISSNIDQGLWINTSADIFFFGDYNLHHKDWLTYSGGTDTPGELSYNGSISNDLTQMVNFPTRIPDCDYSYAWSCSLCEGRTSFSHGTLENSSESQLCF